MLNALEPWHLIIIVGVVVVLFGAKRLPGSARSLGQSMRIFRTEMAQAKQDPSATATAPVAVAAVPMAPVPVTPVPVTSVPVTSVPMAPVPMAPVPAAAFSAGPTPVASAMVSNSVPTNLIAGDRS